MNATLSTELIVLSKTPYKETSLIINGLSPDFGKLGFLVKGAKTISKKKFPVVDLFRVIQMEFKDTGRDLFSIYSAELVKNYDDIGSDHRAYLRLCELSRFIMNNSKIMLESPMVFEAFHSCLENLNKGKWNVPWCDLVKLAYLEENGLLPDRLCPQAFDDENEQQQRLLLSRILDSAIGDTPPPKLPIEYWGRVSEWIKDLCKFHNLIPSSLR